MVIPNKANRVNLHPFDAEKYRTRNVIERSIGRIKDFRAIATRYDKTARNFLSAQPQPASLAVDIAVGGKLNDGTATRCAPDLYTHDPEGKVSTRTSTSTRAKILLALTGRSFAVVKVNRWVSSLIVHGPARVGESAARAGGQERCARGESVSSQGDQRSWIDTADHHIGRLCGVTPRSARDKG